MVGSFVFAMSVCACAGFSFYAYVCMFVCACVRVCTLFPFCFDDIIEKWMQKI